MRQQTAYCRLSAHISRYGVDKVVRMCSEEFNCSSANQPSIEHPPVFSLIFQLIRHNVQRAFGITDPCTYGVCRQGRLCPHAVQVALATDCSRVLGRREGAIASMDVIVARDAANQVRAGLGKRCGGAGGSPSPIGKERAEESEVGAINQCFGALM